MDQPFDFSPTKGNGIVYITPVSMDLLPEDVRAQMPDVSVIYSVNRPDGERLALVKDREMAFMLARQHDFAPVSVH